MIDDFLERLYGEGVAHDARAKSHAEKMLNITPATGRFLEILILETRPKRILEIGTSNGYSTIWLAAAARQITGSVVSLDHDPKKIELAIRNTGIASLAKWVSLQLCDAGEYLKKASDLEFDFVFLDSDRLRYVEWLPDLRRVLQFGTLVVDNAVSHADEVAAFRDSVELIPDLDSIVLPIGNGQFVVRCKLDKFKKVFSDSLKAEAK